MVKVNQDVENIKEEILKLQETVNGLKETIELNKVDATSSKVELEHLENNLSKMKKEALEISDLNHFNKQKLIKINTELSATNEIFKVGEKRDKKLLDGAGIWLIFILVSSAIFFISVIPLLSYEKTILKQIDPNILMMLWMGSIVGLWILSFILIQKFLLWKSFLVLKKDYDKIYALFICVALIASALLLVQDQKEGVMDNEVFLQIFSIPFAAIPSFLIKPFLLDDKRIFVEQKGKN